jgi:OFA family oxalate/formate antiporter-like MFS transporter
LGNYRTLTVVYLSMAALMVLLTLGSGAAAFYIGAVGIGFVYAGVLTIFPSLTSQNFGMRNQGMNYGFMYAGFGLGSVISPYVTSAIGAGGSYSPVFMLAIFLLVSGVVMIQVMQRMGQRAINQAKGAEAH